MTKYNYLAVSALIGELVKPGHTDDAAEKIKANNPVDLVTASVPPTLISHGAKDDMVSYSNSVRLYDKLQSAGVDSVFITYPNSDHLLEDDPQSNIEKAKAFAELAAKYL